MFRLAGWGDKIEAVEIMAETPKTFRIRALDSKYVETIRKRVLEYRPLSLFPTWKAAHATQVARAKNRVARFKADVIVAKKNLAKTLRMKEPRS